MGLCTAGDFCVFISKWKMEDKCRFSATLFYVNSNIPKNKFRELPSCITDAIVININNNS